MPSKVKQLRWSQACFTKLRGPQTGSEPFGGNMLNAILFACSLVFLLGCNTGVNFKNIEEKDQSSIVKEQNDQTTDSGSPEGSDPILPSELNVHAVQGYWITDHCQEASGTYVKPIRVFGSQEFATGYVRFKDSECEEFYFERGYHAVEIYWGGKFYLKDYPASIDKKLLGSDYYAMANRGTRRLFLLGWELKNPDQIQSYDIETGELISTWNRVSDLAIEDDLDADMIPNTEDNCPQHSNPAQIDHDEDGAGSACEDSDSDGHLDIYDNCPLVANSSQADSDEDYVGDVCDCVNRNINRFGEFSYDGGEGTEEEPYLISSLGAFEAIGHRGDSYGYRVFQLTQDIDLSVCIDKYFHTIGNFHGELHGQGHVISNFTNVPIIMPDGRKQYGDSLISRFSNSKVTDLILTNFNYTLAPDWRWAGLFFAESHNSEITGLHVDGRIEHNQDSIARPEFTHISIIGGIGGYAYETTIYQSSSHGTLQFDGNHTNLGGIFGIGIIAGMTNPPGWTGFGIHNSYSTMNLNSTSNGSSIGGLIGRMVHTRQDVGLSEFTYQKVVTNSYFAGEIAEQNQVTGGIIGEVSIPTGFQLDFLVQNSYWDGDNIPLVTSQYGEARTQSQLQQQTNFENWDFGSVWQIDEGNDYPRLR
jgi:hypothetical protein